MHFHGDALLPCEHSPLKHRKFAGVVSMDEKWHSCFSAPRCHLLQRLGCLQKPRSAELQTQVAVCCYLLRFCCIFVAVVLLFLLLFFCIFLFVVFFIIFVFVVVFVVVFLFFLLFFLLLFLLLFCCVFCCCFCCCFVVAFFL